MGSVWVATEANNLHPSVPTSSIVLLMSGLCSACSVTIYHLWCCHTIEIPYIETRLDLSNIVVNAFVVPSHMVM